MDFRIILGLSILILVYALIAFNLIHRTIAALFGALLVGVSMYVFRLGTVKEMVGFISFDTLVLLMSMMIIVGILGKTGFFQVVAYRTAKMAGGNPWKILVGLTLLTALLSAFLDNVTTILLVLPVTLELSSALKANPVPYILSEIFASNIGGTATLVGDPPNMMIGTESGIGFTAFIINLAPIVIIDLFILILIMALLYGKEIKKSVSLDDSTIKRMEKEYRIVDRALYYKSIGILIFTVALFIIGDLFLDIPPMASAFTGATLLLLVSGEDIKGALDHVEWPTLLFFAGLFVVVGGAERMGVIDSIADSVIYISGHSMFMAIISVIWISAFASSIIDNIPFTATMIPVVFTLSSGMGVDAQPLLWALSLGACMGGNGTLIGASANVVGVGMAERNGILIDFKTFLKNGIVVTLVTVGVATLYLVMKYAVMG